MGVVQDESVPSDVRVKASMYITDRIYGRAPEFVAVDMRGDEPPWLRAIRQSIVEVRLVPTEGDAIDADIVEPESLALTPSDAGSQQDQRGGGSGAGT